jgi:hypothetical protein
MTEIHKPGTGAIFGIVTEEGIAKEGSPVYLYDNRRHVGPGQKRLLSRRFTREDGGFEFAGLNQNYGDYMVMVTDEDGATPKNALVQDRVLPIPAHFGAGSYAEWYVRAMQDGAQAGWVAWPVIQDGTGEPVPRGLFGRPFQNTTHPVSWPPNLAAPPEIPTMAVAQSNINGWGFITAGRRIGRNFDIGASIELLIDLDSIATQGGESFFVAATTATGGAALTTLGSHWETLSRYSNSGGTNGINSFPRLVIGILANKTVRLYMPSDIWPWADNRTVGWGFNQVVQASFDLSALTGTVHLIATFTPADAFRLYINGALFGTAVPTTLSGVSASSGSLWSFCGVVSGINTVSANNSELNALRQNFRTYLTSLFVQYDRPLSAAQALEHYKALYDNTLISPVSGYAREVLQETPVMYWRMDDFVEGVRHSFASEVNWKDPLTGSGHHSARLSLVGSAPLVTSFVESPVAGRNTIGVVRGNGNRFQNDFASTFGWLFRNRGAFSCWAKFDLAAPAVTEFLAEFHQVNSSTSFFDVYRTTGNRIVVRLVEAGTLNTYTFTDYVVPQNAWQYIAVTIDKTGVENASNGLLKLYVGDGTTAPSLVQTILIPLSALYTTLDFASSASSGNISFRVQTHRELTGSVCELAVFPDVLTPARIEAHWAARTVV